MSPSQQSACHLVRNPFKGADILLPRPVTAKALASPRGTSRAARKNLTLLLLQAEQLIAMLMCSKISKQLMASMFWQLSNQPSLQ